MPDADDTDLTHRPSDTQLRVAQARYGALADAPGPIVERTTVMRDRAEVEERLPDILSRALALSWIDRAFRAALIENPRRALESHGVHLPATILIECETGPDIRPRVTVYEEGRLLRRRQRIMQLQLVMLAGR